MALATNFPANPIPGYHSSSPYYLGIENTSDIYHACIYNGGVYAPTVMPWKYQHLHPLLNEIPRHDSWSWQSFGRLGCLPLELLQQICLEMNPVTLAKFRTINVTASRIVENMPEYHEMLILAPNTFCDVLRYALPDKQVQRPLNFSFRHFHRLLYDAKCTTCGAFGHLLDMKEGKKYCKVCLERRRCEESEHIPISAIPVLDPKTKQGPKIRACWGCLRAKSLRIITPEMGPWVDQALSKQYTMEEYLNHFVWCQEAQKWWTDLKRWKDVHPNHLILRYLQLTVPCGNVELFKMMELNVDHAPAAYEITPDSSPAPTRRWLKLARRAASAARAEARASLQSGSGLNPPHRLLRHPRRTAEATRVQTRNQRQPASDPSPLRRSARLPRSNAGRRQN